VVREGRRLSAQGHAHGIYKHLASGDRDSLTRRALVLFSSLHDTGQMEMEAESTGKVRVALRDFGLPSREFCALTTGYIAATFELGGREGVRVEKHSCCVDRAPACTWFVSWKKRRA
jgi:predicted hydrocarbon binding protein